MLVETYECEETATETPELADEAMAIIDKLELTGQREMSARKDAGDRCPYRKMEADEMFIFGELCPQKTELKKYADSPIPIRVLQIAAHATDYFDNLVVWHPSAAAEKDPVLVGMKKPKTGEWRQEAFILARWGSVLEEMPALTKKALAAYRARIAAYIGRVIQRANADLNSLGTMDVSGAISLGADPIYSGRP